MTYPRRSETVRRDRRHKPSMRDLSDGKSVCFEQAGAKTYGFLVDGSYLGDKNGPSPPFTGSFRKVAAKINVSPN